MKAIGGGLLIIFALIAGGFVAQRLFGSRDAPLSIGEAREAFEAMPYPVSIRESPAHVLIGEVRGAGGLVVHFAAADSEEAADIPPRLRNGDKKAGSGGDFWVWDDAEVAAHQRSEREGQEATEISVGLEDALCRKATGKACPE